MEGVTLITPTGGRPEAFALCEHHMARQNYAGPLQWIVVDDCHVPTPCSMGQTVVRRTPYWQPRENTQHANMLAALPLVAHDCIAIIEDDDYYAPGYLTHMVGMLQSADLVGLRAARYYNVRDKVYRVHGNGAHSSLCTTAMHRNVLPLLTAICTMGAPWIDMTLWEQWAGSKRLEQPGNPLLSLGIKGLPGRPGIGRGHQVVPSHRFSADHDGSKLREWLGADADLYRRWV